MQQSTRRAGTAEPGNLFVTEVGESHIPLINHVAQCIPLVYTETALSLHSPFFFYKPSPLVLRKWHQK